MTRREFLLAPLVFDWSFYPSFTRTEFDCHDGTPARMHAVFMHRLQLLRNRIGPLLINSGYRTPEYNSRVSTTGSSGPHTTGRAVDIAISGPRAHELLRVAIDLGFTGIGVKQHGPHQARFIHLDDLHGPTRPRIWSY